MIYIFVVTHADGTQEAVRRVYDDGENGSDTYADVTTRLRSLQRLYGVDKVQMISHRQVVDDPRSAAEQESARREYEAARRRPREVISIEGLRQFTLEAPE